MHQTRKILVTGGNGQVAYALQQLQISDDYAMIRLPKSQLDITQSAHISQVIADIQPCFVINTAAYTDVEQAERSPAIAFAINRDGAHNLAQLCMRSNIPLLHLSTDYIFDGMASNAYQETYRANPINVYGDSKWQGEQAVRAACTGHIILRTSSIFGEHGNNFVKTIFNLARTRSSLNIVCDQIMCPTPAIEVAKACFAIIQHILKSGELESAANHWGTYHYCSNQPVSWYDFSRELIAAGRISQPLCVENIHAITSSEFAAHAKRPAYSVLCCDKIVNQFGIHPKSWCHGLKATVKKISCDTGYAK